MSKPPTVSCAPDSFKGTVSALEAAEALSVGIRSVASEAVVQVLPMADGGEGTMEVIASTLSGRWHQVEVRSSGREGTPQRGRWYETTEGFGIVEVADTAGFMDSGLQISDPESATTYPVGEVILSALDQGISHLMIGLGGSRTVDGGVGLLQALGAGVVVDGARLDRPCLGADLLRLDSIDPGPARDRCAGIRIEVAVDVRNPLCGPNGAAAVYGPQKGAGPDAVARLAAGLERLSDLLGASGSDEGDGAAGGAGYGLRVGLGGLLRPGARAVGELVGLPAACNGVDLVVTGEGCYDDQTPNGKVAWEVGRLAAEAGVPVALVAGRLARSSQAMAHDPFARHVSLEAAFPEITCHLERLRRAGAHLAEVHALA